jgi:hypothetical protein
MPSSVLSTIPTGRVDVPYGLALLFLGLIVRLCLYVLTLALAIGMHDVW